MGTDHFVCTQFQVQWAWVRPKNYSFSSAGGHDCPGRGTPLCKTSPKYLMLLGTLLLECQQHSPLGVLPSRNLHPVPYFCCQRDRPLLPVTRLSAWAPPSVWCSGGRSQLVWGCGHRFRLWVQSSLGWTHSWTLHLMVLSPVTFRVYHCLLKTLGLLQTRGLYLQLVSMPVNLMLI